MIISRFGYHSTALEVVEDYDLTGKQAILTGGASGIGAETVRALAYGGADTTLMVRNSSAARPIVDRIAKESPGARVHVVQLDLGSLSSIRRAAASYLDRDLPLEILINNAGVMAAPLQRTFDDFEQQIGVNHLGHLALTMALLPSLRRANGSRVVSLSSSAHRRSDVHLEDLNYEHRPYDKWEAYGQSKTANALFAVALTERFQQDGIFSNAVMPGGILTGLQKYLSDEEQRELGFLDENGEPNALFKSPAQGASTSLWAAVGDELQDVGGLYLENCAEAGLMDPALPFQGYMPYARDAESAAVLWDLSIDLLNQSS